MNPKRRDLSFLGRAIHIVDDQSEIVNLVTSALERKGYPVNSFTDPSKALQDIEMNCRVKVSMLIADLQLACHIGFEIARRTRVNNPGVPIILMTPFEINSAEFFMIFPSVTVIEFLQKPFHVQRLLGLVKKYAKYVA
jgi:DNA-binding NtrC family response regulator